MYGHFDEEILMTCPEGLDGTTDQDALKLQNCIYDLVQGTGKYHKKMVEVLTNIGFEGGDVIHVFT